MTGSLNVNEKPRADGIEFDRGDQGFAPQTESVECLLHHSIPSHVCFWVCQIHWERTTISRIAFAPYN